MHNYNVDTHTHTQWYYITAILNMFFFRKAHRGAQKRQLVLFNAVSLAEISVSTKRSKVCFDEHHKEKSHGIKKGC